MDTYADDLAALIVTLDLKGTVLIGFSTGGGEVARCRRLANRRVRRPPCGLCEDREELEPQGISRRATWSDGHAQGTAQRRSSGFHPSLSDDEND
jgi:hypothetical protein